MPPLPANLRHPLSPGPKLGPRAFPAYFPEGEIGGTPSPPHGIFRPRAMPALVFQRRRARQRHRGGCATRCRGPRLGQGSLGEIASFRAEVSPDPKACPHDRRSRRSRRGRPRASRRGADLPHRYSKAASRRLGAHRRQGMHHCVMRKGRQCMKQRLPPSHHGRGQWKSRRRKRPSIAP